MTLDWNLQPAVWDELKTIRDADRVPMGNNEVRSDLLENF